MSQVKSSIHYGFVASLLVLILVFVLQRNLSAQNAEAIQINSLPQEGFLLDQGWKFYKGDHPDFANPEFDDTNWEKIDPTVDINLQNASIRTGICWLRLTVYLSDSLRPMPLSLLINQYVASEIHLNGSLVYSFGVVSSDQEEVVGFNPSDKPVALPIYDVQKMVFAIRFAVQPLINYDYGSTVLPLLSMRLFTTNDAFHLVRKQERYIPLNNTFRFGAYLLLAILYLAFFIYNPRQKAYLFFSFMPS